MLIKKIARYFLYKCGYVIVRASSYAGVFHSDAYLRHTSRRLEHLASLGVDVSGKSVLEVGAGIGDLSHYYVDRGCTITITEGRSVNLAFLRERYPDLDVRSLDVENPVSLDGPFDIVHCYGLLYHVKNPEKVIEFLAGQTRSLLFLETRVSFGDEVSINYTEEKRLHRTEAISGIGCEPTRAWLMNELKKHFDFAYMTVTQPNHDEFPIDWPTRSFAQLLNR